MTNDPRPLETLAELIENRFHTVVTYDDPKWGSGDVIDVTAASWKSTHPFDIRRFYGYPRRSVQIEDYELAAAENATLGQDKILQLNAVLASAFSKLGEYGARFASVTDGAYIHVIPRGGSPLDLTVNVNTNGFVTLYQALDMLCKQLSRERGSTVVIGTVPINYLEQHKVSSHEGKATARKILMDLLNDMRPEYAIHLPAHVVTWKLLYSYDGDLYALNLNGVAADQQSAPITLPPTTNGPSSPSRAIRVNNPAPPAPHP